MLREIDFHTKIPLFRGGADAVNANDPPYVQPVAMETLGSWGPSGLKFIQDIGDRIAQHNGDKRSASFLFQAISMAVQRGNIASIRGSVPDTKTLSELYYL